MRKKEEEEQRRIVEEERQRLLQQNVERLVGHIPRGVLSQVFEINYGIILIYFLYCRLMWRCWEGG